jgi:hypothetical protein
LTFRGVRAVGSSSGTGLVELRGMSAGDRFGAFGRLARSLATVGRVMAVGIRLAADGVGREGAGDACGSVGLGRTSDKIL